jgi:hypothetical protein
MSVSAGGSFYIAFRLGFWTQFVVYNIYAGGIMKDYDKVSIVNSGSGAGHLLGRLMAKRMSEMGGQE